MKGVTATIKEKIWRKRKGAIFFSDDFLMFGTRSSINKALSNLCNDQLIIRLAPGIYCKPETDRELGLGIIYPSVDEIAKAIATRDKARIIPTGVYAQNRLGLSTQVPMNYVYLTDGTPRRIKIYGGKGILFKRVSPKLFRFKSQLSMMLTLALKEFGEGNINPEQKNAVKRIINTISKESISQDFALMPDWIRKLITSLYD